VRFSHLPHVVETQQLCQALAVDQAVALRRSLNLPISTIWPFHGMLHYAGAHHIEIDVDQSTSKVAVALDGGREVAVFPEGTFAAFPAVVLLRGAAGYQLHAPRDLAFAPVEDQKVNMIGCNNIIQNAKAVSSAGTV
jgi:hypothetical protein